MFEGIGLCEEGMEEKSSKKLSCYVMMGIMSCEDVIALGAGVVGEDKRGRRRERTRRK